MPVGGVGAQAHVHHEVQGGEQGAQELQRAGDRGALGGGIGRRVVLVRRVADDPEQEDGAQAGGDKGVEELWQAADPPAVLAGHGGDGQLGVVGVCDEDGVHEVVRGDGRVVVPQVKEGMGVCGVQAVLSEGGVGDGWEGVALGGGERGGGGGGGGGAEEEGGGQGGVGGGGGREAGAVGCWVVRHDDAADQSGAVRADGGSTHRPRQPKGEQQIA